MELRPKYNIGGTRRIIYNYATNKYLKKGISNIESDTDYVNATRFKFIPPDSDVVLPNSWYIRSGKSEYLSINIINNLVDYSLTWVSDKQLASLFIIEPILYNIAIFTITPATTYRLPALGVQSNGDVGFYTTTSPPYNSMASSICFSIYNYYTVPDISRIDPDVSGISYSNQIVPNIDYSLRSLKTGITFSCFERYEINIDVNGSVLPTSFIGSINKFNQSDPSNSSGVVKYNTNTIGLLSSIRYGTSSRYYFPYIVTKMYSVPDIYSTIFLLMYHKVACPIDNVYVLTGAYGTYLNYGNYYTPNYDPTNPIPGINTLNSSPMFWYIT